MAPNATQKWTVRRLARYVLAGFGGAVIGFLTGAASGEAAAIALSATWAHPAWIGALVGGLAGLATGLVAADD
jgi:ABC-type enterobactin transport system permease subunit